MKVEVKVAAAAIAINLGDLFHKVGSEEVFMLHSSHEQIKLVSFSGQGTWTKYDNMTQAARQIGECIERGTFRHYPQNSFKLILEVL